MLGERREHLAQLHRLAFALRPPLFAVEAVAGEQDREPDGRFARHGGTFGDVAPDVYERDDLTITPIKGGVGPLTVCALFENVIRAARSSVNK